MPGLVKSYSVLVSNRDIALQSGLSPSDFRALLDKLDIESQQFIYSFSDGCHGSACSNPRVVVRVPCLETLILNGLIDERICGYEDAELNLGSKNDIREVLSQHNLPFPAELSKPTMRWSKVKQYLQSLYDSSPDVMQSIFAVVDGTALTYDKATVISRRLGKMLFSDDEYI